MAGRRAWDRPGLIEQALFFAIGFLVASLAAVVAMPIMSRRAMRLARARAALNAPVTEKQAIAERDALRAVHAVEQVRLEHRFEAAEEASAELRAALGRQSVKVIEFEADSAERERVIFDQRAEIERGALERHELQVALGASQIALHDALAQRDRVRAAEGAAALRQSELEAEASRDRARIAILSARTQDLEGRLEGLSRQDRATPEKTAAVMAQLAAERARARDLEGRLSEAISRNKNMTERLSRGEVDRNEFGRRLADLEARLLESERIREETLVENGRLLATLADREANMSAAPLKAIEHKTLLTGDRGQEVAAGSLGTKAPTVPQTAPEDGRHAAWVDRQTLREIDALRARAAAIAASASGASDDAMLRDSIQNFGLDISRLYAGHSPGVADSRDHDNPNAESLGESKGPDGRGVAEVPLQRLAR